MHTITILSTKRDRVVETGADFIDVHAAIQLDGETVAERHLGFPLDSSEETIAAELKNVLAAYVTDQEIAVQTQRSEELNTHADELQAKLEGMTIEHE